MVLITTTAYPARPALSLNRPTYTTQQTDQCSLIGIEHHRCDSGLLDAEGEREEVLLWCPSCDTYWHTGMHSTGRIIFSIDALKTSSVAWYSNAKSSASPSPTSILSHRILVGSETEDDTDNQSRPTERLALGNIERYWRAVRTAGKGLAIPPFYFRIIRLDRAAMRYCGNLNRDERIEFILVNLHDGVVPSVRKARFGAQMIMPMAITPREVETYLSHSNDIILARDLLGYVTTFNDFTKTQAEYLRDRYMNAPRVVRLAA